MSQQDQGLPEIKLDASDMYREEVFTDRRAGTLRRMIPVTPSGAEDPTRHVLYAGQTQLMTPGGVLPLMFKDGMTRKSLGLDGSEIFDIFGLAGPGKAGNIKPGMDVNVRITRANGKVEEIKVLCRIDTAEEVEYYRHGGVLPYVLRNLAAA